MKVTKNYRIHPVYVQEMEELKKIYPEMNETELVEKAIDFLNYVEVVGRKWERSAYRLLDGTWIHFEFSEKV